MFDFFEYFNNTYLNGYNNDIKPFIIIIFILYYIIYLIESFVNNVDNKISYNVFDKFFFFKLFCSFILFIFNISIILIINEIIYQLFDVPQYKIFIILFFIYIITAFIKIFNIESTSQYLFNLTYKLSIIKDLIIEEKVLKKNIKKNYNQFKQNLHLKFK